LAVKQHIRANFSPKSSKQSLNRRKSGKIYNFIKRIGVETLKFSNKEIKPSPVNREPSPVNPAKPARNTRFRLICKFQKQFKPKHPPRQARKRDFWIFFEYFLSNRENSINFHTVKRLI